MTALMHDSEAYGYNLFETLMTRYGRFRQLRFHWLRLNHSASIMNLKPPSWSSLLQSIERAHNPDCIQIIRITLRRTGGRWANEPTGQELRLSVGEYKPPPNCVELQLCRTRFPCRDLQRRHKSGSRWLYQRSLDLARDAGYDDALLCDRRNRFLETTTSNIFLLRDGLWQTPPLSLGLLPGSYRAWLLQSSDRVRVRPIDIGQFSSIKAAIVTNSVIGALPVARIGNQTLATAESRRFIESSPLPPWRTINQYAAIDD